MCKAIQVIQDRLEGGKKRRVTHSRVRAFGAPSTEWPLLESSCTFSESRDVSGCPWVSPSVPHRRVLVRSPGILSLGTADSLAWRVLCCRMNCGMFSNIPASTHWCQYLPRAVISKNIFRHCHMSWGGQHPAPAIESHCFSPAIFPFSIRPQPGCDSPKCQNHWDDFSVQNTHTTLSALLEKR